MWPLSGRGKESWLLVLNLLCCFYCLSVLVCFLCSCISFNGLDRTTPGHNHTIFITYRLFNIRARCLILYRHFLYIGWSKNLQSHFISTSDTPWKITINCRLISFLNFILGTYLIIVNKYHGNKTTCHIPYRMRDSGQIVLWSGSTLSLRPGPPSYTCNEGGNHSNKPKFCLEPGKQTVVLYHYFVMFEYILESISKRRMTNVSFFIFL